MSILDDFFGSGNNPKVCACGATENLTGVSYDAQVGEYGIWICPQCKAGMDTNYAAQVTANARIGARIEANTEMHDQ